MNNAIYITQINENSKRLEELNMTEPKGDSDQYISYILLSAISTIESQTSEVGDAQHRQI
jgi:hypothetical protein